VQACAPNGWDQPDRAERPAARRLLRVRSRARGRWPCGTNADRYATLSSQMVHRPDESEQGNDDSPAAAHVSTIRPRLDVDSRFVRRLSAPACRWHAWLPSVSRSNPPWLSRVDARDHPVVADPLKID
jgi:hypothetical protein